MYVCERQLFGNVHLQNQTTQTVVKQIINTMAHGLDFKIRKGTKI